MVVQSVSPWAGAASRVRVPRFRVQLAGALDPKPGSAGRHVNNRQWRALRNSYVAGQKGQQILHDRVKLRLRDTAPGAQTV